VHRSTPKGLVPCPPRKGLLPDLMAPEKRSKGFVHLRRLCGLPLFNQNLKRVCTVFGDDLKHRIQRIQVARRGDTDQPVCWDRVWESSCLTSGVAYPTLWKHEKGSGNRFRRARCPGSHLRRTPAESALTVIVKAASSPFADLQGSFAQPRPKSPWELMGGNNLGRYTTTNPPCGQQPPACRLPRPPNRSKPWLSRAKLRD